MAKSLDYTFDLPYAPEEMFQQGIRPDYVAAQAKALNHYDLEVTKLEDGPEGGSATAKYEIEVDLPSWAKKILQPRNKVTEFRSWGPPEADGARVYNFIVKIENVPADIKGIVRLAPTADGTTENSVHISLRCGLPIFGSKLEELVAKDLEKNVKGEVAFISTWMKQQGY